MRRSLPVVHFVLVIAVVISLAGVVAGNGPGGEVEFPYLLKIAPGNVLLVHGHEFQDEVLITWDLGDSLRIEGMAILPTPPVAPRLIDEERLADLYSGSPFVTALVESGATWAEASDEYCREQSAVLTAVADLYWSSLDSTGSHDRAISEATRSLESPVLDPGFEPVASRSSILIRWDDQSTELVFLKRRPPDTSSRQIQEISASRAEGETRTLASLLSVDRTGTTIVVISPRVYSIWSGEKATRALGQLEEARNGRKALGPIDDTELDRIIRAHGGD